MISYVTINAENLLVLGGVTDDEVPDVLPGAAAVAPTHKERFQQPLRRKLGIFQVGFNIKCKLIMLRLPRDVVDDEERREEVHEDVEVVPQDLGQGPTGAQHLHLGGTLDLWGTCGTPWATCAADAVDSLIATSCG